jgi:ATP-dependent Lon protease
MFNNFKNSFVEYLGEEEIENPEFITIMNPVDDGDSDLGDENTVLPILPLRNTVMFPGVVIPITVGREMSVKLIREAYKKDKTIGVVSQHNADVESPIREDLYTTGTLAHIVKMLKMPDGNITVIIQGKRRFDLERIVQEDPYMVAEVSHIKEGEVPTGKKFKALLDSIRELANKIVEQSPTIPNEATIALKNIESPNFLINFIASHLNVSVADRQKVLEIKDITEKANKVLEFLTDELQQLELKNQIQNKVRVDLDKQQREYFLHQQIRAIHEELGEDNPDVEIQKLRLRGKEKQWNKEVSERFNKELDKLSRTNASSPDYSVSLNYVELFLDLPWNEYSKDNFDLKQAMKVLDRDHFGLDKVKQRILEYLAVLKLKGDMKSPILCLYGPPGVGKTSLGKSVAEAVGRKYIRMSLGGLHDESELRGHRKTYIGAMPGRIIQSIKKAKISNPVFVLDEIDKIGNDFRGDPSSALLEILDPEQNSSFYDNYLEMEYDLSKIMFIATANRLDTIQPALLDRMEIIEINGYTTQEKVEIAKKYLIPKQRKAHGLKAKELKVSDAILSYLVDNYTRESGVRGLEKRLAAICRRRAMEVVRGDEFRVSMSKEDIDSSIGNEKRERDMYTDLEVAGVVTGLAWTSVGGVILTVESSLTRGKGKLTLTGQLGSVMKESAITVTTFLRDHAQELGIDYRLFDQYDIHIHFPAGAVPKDGPSAGITILTALASLFTQRKVKPNLAMTGEITLRGKVLPVGGIKEKILAAKRAGIKEIVLCKVNKKDIDDIRPEYVKNLKFHYVENMLDVLDIALLKRKVKNPRTWELKSAKSGTATARKGK